MRKKIIAAMLVVAMMGSICTGCANENAATGEKESDSKVSEESVPVEDSSESTAEDETSGWLVDEETTITILSTTNVELTKDSWVFQKIKEKTGIQIDPIAYPYEVAKEKLSTYIGSGELPDIVFSLFSTEEIDMYGLQGAIASPMDYIDVMPNFKSLIIDNPDMNAVYEQYVAANGKNYQIPLYRLNRDVNHGNMYRADVFEELDIEPWGAGDTEGFYNALVALKKAYPDSYPFVGTSTVGLGRLLLNFDVDVDDETGTLGYDSDSEEWYIACTSEKYKEYLDFCKKLYTEGLIDPEYLNATVDTFNEAMLNDKGFVCNEWIGRMAALDNLAKESDPNTTFNLVYGYPIGNGKVRELDQLSPWGNAVTQNENTEVSMKLIDWLYSAEGSEIITIGIEGDNFEWDENGKPVYPELNLETVGIGDLEAKYGMWSEGYCFHADRRSVYYAFTEKEQAAQDLINNECGYTKIPPQIKVEDADLAEYNALVVELQDKMNAFQGNYICNASYGETEWEEFVNTITKDYGKILELVN